MKKSAIYNYAVWARNELIDRVTQKAEEFGISEAEIIPASADSVRGKLLTATQKKQRTALIERIKTKGKNGLKLVVEEVAYTWFNRFTAIRFMEVNGYLPSHVRVFTDDENSFAPQILAEAIHLDIPGLNKDTVYELKQANKVEELYKYLLIIQCNALNEILPGMFQKIEDYTELLLPDNLLREGSVIEQMISLIPEEDWTDQVQIIGWLYQYYNVEPKAAVFSKTGKISKNEIPAATQLFTPDWIVRYMVENSLGRLWIEGHPNEDLKSNWKYYLDEAAQEDIVKMQLAKIRQECAGIKPEELKIIDPCMGSGHILCYIFDVLVQIYESYGYTARDAVTSIIENNIYGLDIDDRASQLAYFSVMMKARQYDRRFFARNLQPHVYAIKESCNISEMTIDYFADGKKELSEEIRPLISTMKNAKEIGSLLTISGINFEILLARCNEIVDDVALFGQEAIDMLIPLIKVAHIMSLKYDVVVTNPPYMGASGMSNELAEFVKKQFPDSKSDLFAAFIEKGNTMITDIGYNSMVTMQSWMFLTSFEKMRKKIVQTRTITNLMHMENMVMGIAFGTAVTIFRKVAMPNYRGTYHHIKTNDIENGVPREFPINGNRFAQVNTKNFANIPGSPIAYWVSPNFAENYKHGQIGDHAEVITGMTIGDNNKYLRLWFEVDRNSINIGERSMNAINLAKRKWIPYSKGGARRNWYGNYEYIVNWSQKDNFNRSKTTLQHLYLLEALTWPFITSGDFSARYLPHGFLWDVAGSPCFFKDKDEQIYTLAMLASKVANYILKVVNPTINVQAIDVSQLPLIIDERYKNRIIELANSCLEISKADWDSFETSWDFKKHPFVKYSDSLWDATAVGATMSKYYGSTKQKFNSPMELCYLLWQGECEERFNTLKANEEELNRLFIEIYGLEHDITPNVEEKDVTVRKADLGRDIRSFISYAVGCMLGRYSLDVEGIVYAGCDWDDSRYITFQADKDNVLPICDDEYFEDDIVGKFVKFVEAVFGNDTLEENLKFIADALGGSGSPRDVIRSYFLNEFYADHCYTYQVTGSGKRPIYWQFDSGKKNGFKCLIYMHRYQPDTIARIRTDYVHEQQARYRTAIADLEQRIQGASTSERVKLTKLLQKLKDQEIEIRLFEEKVHHLADQMIRIDLDNGVKHNYEIFKDVLTKIK